MSKSEGWFSRRHKNREGLDKYREEKELDTQDFFYTLDSNRASRKNRSAKQQLALLDERLGKGIGAKKERKRLEKKSD